MIPTNQKTFFRVSGILAIIAAVFYIVIGICIGFDPSEQKSGVEYYLELFKNPSLGYLWRILFSLTGLMNIMIFIAYGNYISKSQDSDYLFVKVLTAIGLISAILHTIDWVRDISFINNCLKFYNENQLENLKAMINMNEVLKYTDENFIWRFGFFGFYVIGVSVVALRKGLLSRGINIIGILSGTFLIFTMIFSITETVLRISDFEMSVMPIFAGIGGSILGPIWYLGLAKNFLKNSNSSLRKS